MRRFSAVPLFALLLFCFPHDEAEAARRRSPRHQDRAIQASNGQQSLAVLSGFGHAEVLPEEGRGYSIRLRKSESLVAVEQTARGLVAAGVRQHKRGSELFVLRSDNRGTRRLPRLPAHEEVRLRPVLLVDSGQLVTAAWLEGPDLRSLRVRTADWDGVNWGPASTVSEPSPGSQTGLAGVTLADGSQLLAWSQYDGSDDEIVFSWRRKSSWSTPRRVVQDNETPDITPALGLAGDGAVLAWSRFDGTDYRLWQARFRRGEWQSATPIGTAGSLFPQFIQHRDESYLVYRNVRPRGWSVRRVSNEGDSRRGAFVASEISERPVLASSTSSSVTLLWPRQGKEIEIRQGALP